MIEIILSNDVKMRTQSYELSSEGAEELTTFHMAISQEKFIQPLVLIPTGEEDEDGNDLHNEVPMVVNTSSVQYAWKVAEEEDGTTETS